MSYYLIGLGIVIGLIWLGVAYDYWADRRRQRKENE